MEEAEQEFAGQGYGTFKAAVGEAVVELFRPIREEAERLKKERDYLEKIYADGAQRAQRIASRTLSKVYRKVGFVAK